MKNRGYSRKEETGKDKEQRRRSRSNGGSHSRERQRGYNKNSQAKRYGGSQNNKNRNDSRNTFISHPVAPIHSDIDPIFNDNSIDEEVNSFKIRAPDISLKFRGRARMRLHELSVYSIRIEAWLERAMNFWLNFSPQLQEEFKIDEKKADLFFLDKFGDLVQWAKYMDPINKEEIGKDVGTHRRLFSRLDLVSSPVTGAFKTSFAVATESMCMIGANRWRNQLPSFFFFFF